jgi:hypothetical protein
LWIPAERANNRGAGSQVRKLKGVAVTTQAKRRMVWAFAIGVGLILLASGILVFAEATAIPDEAKRCAPSIWQSQWPRYLGCAMTTHDGLAGGLIAAGGALFAALLAIDAIQQQVPREVERQKVEQAEAKISAVTRIAPLIRSAAECLFSVNKAIDGSPEVDELVALATSHVNAEMSRFVVPEGLRGLSLDDRLVYLTMIGALSVFVSISERPSPIRTRVQRLETQRDALMKLHGYLRAFDPDLARVFARDSKTSPPESPLATPPHQDIG